MMRVAVGVAVLLGLAPAAGIACSFPSYQEAGIVIHADRLAERMVEAAATVDLVEVGTIESWDPVAYFASERAEAIAEARPEWVADVQADYNRYEAEYRLFGASTVTFRVIERLKGAGDNGFSFGAFVFQAGHDDYDFGELADQIPRTGPLPTGETLYMNHIVDLVDFQGPGSCSAPLVVTEGLRYLIFRDADGRLLRGAVPVTDRRQPPLQAVDGPVFEGVAGEDDIWLSAVRAASLR